MSGRNIDTDIDSGMDEWMHAWMSRPRAEILGGFLYLERFPLHLLKYPLGFYNGDRSICRV